MTLQWTDEERESYLLKKYGKRTALELTSDELSEFLDYIQSQPDDIDFVEIIARTNIEMKRLGWTNEQGRQYLQDTYDTNSRTNLADEEFTDFAMNRAKLTDEELIEFLAYLESQP